MSRIKDKVAHLALRIADVVLLPLTLLGSLWLGIARRYGVERLPLTRWSFLRIGVFPIRDHYYEPQFKFRAGASLERSPRELPGIDLNVEGQLSLLDHFRFQEELKRFPLHPTRVHEFYYENPMLGPGDAEYLYSLARLIKPRRVIEIGCGFSTLMIRNAVRRNEMETKGYECLHTCIEPYENPWLAQTGVRLLRQRLEEVPWKEFSALEQNDILFIDSSHIIRPGGDVLREYLEILPQLNAGVYVHIHDIFTPFDYPEEWIRRQVRFWNEQYLVEAFLTCNREYQIVGALHYLNRRFPECVSSRFPILATGNQQFQPGSFWIKKHRP